jgi:hypothetical protein
MKKKSEWIKELTEDIIRLKNKGRKKLYLISAEMNTETANGIEKHFSDQGYSVETKKCQSCKNNWDIIIDWSKNV